MKVLGAFFAWLVVSIPYVDAFAATTDAAADLKVWNAVVEHLCHGDFAQRVILSAETRGVRDGQPAGLEANQQVWSSLQARNSRPAAVPSKVACHGLRVVPEGDIEGTFNRKEAKPPKWDRFSEVFAPAKSILRLSAPGFSATDDVALVLGSITGCDGFCDHGFYYELERRGTGWTVVRVVTAWIS